MNFLQRIIVGDSIQEIKDLMMSTQADLDAKIAELNTEVEALKAAEAKLKTDNDALAGAIKTFIAANVSSIDISGLQAVIDGITTATVDIQATDASIVSETASITPTPIVP